MKEINSIISVIILTLILNGCNEHKQAVKKLFKETHEKELISMVDEFENNAEKINSCTKFKNGVYLGKSDEWNEKILPLMDKITEHHKQYHENYIYQDDGLYNEWYYYFFHNSDYKAAAKYSTACPFCRGKNYDYKNIPKSFEETSLYRNKLEEKIIQEELKNLDENEFLEIMKELKRLVDENDAFLVTDDLKGLMWTEEFDKGLSQLKELHLKYHQFSDEFSKEFMSYYYIKSDGIKNSDFFSEENKYAPVFDNDYTCCPWCRLFIDSEIAGTPERNTYDSYYIADLGFFHVWGMDDKWIEARNIKEKEMRETGEKEALKYLNAFTSYFERGKLGVEIKNSRDCPSVLFIPAYIEGIEVGEVYIQGVDSLKEVWLPKTAKTASFPNCHNLEKVHLNEGLKAIGFGGFVCCYKLKSIQIPDSVERIPMNAFLNCISLEELNLPKSLTFLGGNFLGLNCIIKAYRSNDNDGYDERFKRYYYETESEKPVKRKALNIIIPDGINTNIVFGQELFSNGKIWHYAFSDTADYISLSTQAKIRNLGYDGNF